MKKFILFFTVFCFFNNSFPNELKYELIVDNLDVPWAFVFLPDDSILITERRGELIHYKNGIKTVIKNLPEIISKNQGVYLISNYIPIILKTNGFTSHTHLLMIKMREQIHLY